MISPAAARFQVRASEFVPETWPPLELNGTFVLRPAPRRPTPPPPRHRAVRPLDGRSTVERLTDLAWALRRVREGLS